jgi:hypothetical protein
MTTNKTSALQIKELLSGLSEHGNRHLTEAETDLIQTNILLKEAITKLSASFMAIHEVVEAQQCALQTVLAQCNADADVVSALELQSAQIGVHVNAAVTGLQFQDMTNQLIGRIMRRINGFRDVLLVVGADADGIPVETDEPRLTALLGGIEEAMRTQSTVLENELWKAVCQTHMESGDIELF